MHLPWSVYYTSCLTWLWKTISHFGSHTSLKRQKEFDRVLDVRGVFRFINSDWDQMEGIPPSSESALWVIITRHQHTQPPDSPASLHAPLSVSLSALPGGATRSNIDHCYVTGRLLTFLPYQWCQSVSTHTLILIIDMKFVQYEQYEKPISVMRRWAGHEITILFLKLRGFEKTRLLLEALEGAFTGSTSSVVEGFTLVN